MDLSKESTTELEAKAYRLHMQQQQLEKDITTIQDELKRRYDQDIQKNPDVRESKTDGNVTEIKHGEVVENP